MALTVDDVTKIAHLARLTLSPNELQTYTQQLSNILEFVEQMNQIDTSKIEPFAYTAGLAERLRADDVTETNQRDAFQVIAPQVEAGLYLVPKVIE